MASVNSSDSKLKKPLPKPLMLKDYLLDDLSSCSSNSFRSYPRRQCCTTVRLLLEIDLKTRDLNRSKRLLKSKSKASSMTISALQRASDALINAVKLLPFSSVKSPSSSKQNKPKKTILPRSFSRKLLRRSFWKKTDHKDTERLKSFRDFLEEKEPSSDFTPSIAAQSATTNSNSSTSNSNSNCNSWTESDFTSDYLPCSGGNSQNSCENDVAESKRRLPENVVSERAGAEVGDDSMEGTTTTNHCEENIKWPIQEEKEQFSPVSVLDFPSDDEEEVSSPFQIRLARLEGIKQKHMQKIRRFESLTQLEPVDLEELIALSESSDEPLELQLCSVSIQGSIVLDKEDEEENETEKYALELLKLMKADSLEFNADTLLLDFFRERITEADALAGGEKFNNELLNIGKDWMSGQSTLTQLLEWEVQRNRQAYVRDMEKAGRWGKLDDEKEEVVMELEVEVLASLINELLLDLFSS
ncbi:hypothetical protein F0562_013299 [Nyssa sinensis]|uniref:DUF4378 domain-containing protein n=1 Tax=Nyssa sinensis TaxID=561372 RepID=A0A5J4ZVF6_9ASTE|nr:hypothetical protein F0562_013299 [Nyssa sinensis]